MFTLLKQFLCNHNYVSHTHDVFQYADEPKTLRIYSYCTKCGKRLTLHSIDSELIDVVESENKHILRNDYE